MQFHASRSDRPDSHEREPLVPHDMELQQSPSPRKEQKDPFSSIDSGIVTRESTADSSVSNPFAEPQEAPTYRVYRRRFIGLASITLLNIINSWNWLTFAPISTTSSQYFNVSDTAINWLSTGFLLSFVVASPAAIWTINRSVKTALVTGATLMIIGGWIRYVGVRAGGNAADGRGTFGVVVLGQVMIGLAQAFVLSAPTRYSDLWFTEKGRITATAVASLANPFGAALGQLIVPFWAADANDIPNTVLWVTVITTVICVPTIWIPSKPPTPPSPTSGNSSLVKVDMQTIRRLVKNFDFWMLTIPFVIYVASFNATSSLLNQIFEPYGFSESEAGIGGALLIVVGLVASAVFSPILDRYRWLRLPTIKVFVPIIAVMYLILIFIPETRSLVGPYIILSVLGATSFALLPLILEYLVDVTWDDAGPEVGSTIAWSGGQLVGGIYIIIMGALKGYEGQPDGSLYRGLIYQAVLALVVVPIPLALGFWGTGRSRRLQSEHGAAEH